MRRRAVKCCCNVTPCDQLNQLCFGSLIPPQTCVLSATNTRRKFDNTLAVQSDGYRCPCLGHPNFSSTATVTLQGIGTRRAVNTGGFGGGAHYIYDLTGTWSFRQDDTYYDFNCNAQPPYSDSDACGTAKVYRTDKFTGSGTLDGSTAFCGVCVVNGAQVVTYSVALIMPGNIRTYIVLNQNGYCGTPADFIVAQDTTAPGTFNTGVDAFPLSRCSFAGLCDPAPGLYFGNWTIPQIACSSVFWTENGTQPMRIENTGSIQLNFLTVANAPIATP